MRYAAIWCGATVVAVGVSWFGVRDVLRSEFVDDVLVRPAQAQTSSAKKTETPVPTRTPTPRRTTKGNVKVVPVKGGEVAFAFEQKGCRLVSATPASGYTAKVVKHPDWIRVDLVKGGHGTGVWCIGKERRTDTWEY